MPNTNLEEKTDLEVDESGWEESDVGIKTHPKTDEQIQIPDEVLNAQVVLEKTGKNSYYFPTPLPSNQDNPSSNREDPSSNQRNPSSNKQGGKPIIYELKEVGTVRINGENIEVPSFEPGFVVENPTNIVFIVPEGEYKHGGAKDENNILEVHPFAMTMGEIAMEGRSKTFLCILKDENRGVDLIQNLKDAGAEIVKVEHGSKKDKTKATMEVNVSSLEWHQPKNRFSTRAEFHTKAGETWLAPKIFHIDDVKKVIRSAPVPPPSLG